MEHHSAEDIDKTFSIKSNQLENEQSSNIIKSHFF